MSTYIYPKDWIEKASAHYAHAIEKHPHFVDRFTFKSKKLASEVLAYDRKVFDLFNKMKDITLELVINEEISEIFDAYTSGRIDEAIEEVYDTISVMMRAAVMLEDMKKET